MAPSSRARFIRFNVQQAILVDILTVVLGLLGTAAGYVMPEGEQFMTNFAFYCLVGAVVYAVAETARGRMANQVCVDACVYVVFSSEGGHVLGAVVWCC